MVFLGQDTFNRYAYMLISNPLVVPVEIGLLRGLPDSPVQGDQDDAAEPRGASGALRDEEHGGRHQPEEPRVVHDDPDGAGAPDLHPDSRVACSSTGPTTTYGTTGIRDLYRLEVENFSSPIAVALYIGDDGARGPAPLARRRQLVPVAGPRGSALHAGHPQDRQDVSAVLIAGGFIVIAVWVFLYGVRS